VNRKLMSPLCASIALMCFACLGSTAQAQYYGSSAFPMSGYYGSNVGYYNAGYTSSGWGRGCGLGGWYNQNFGGYADYSCGSGCYTRSYTYLATGCGGCSPYTYGYRGCGYGGYSGYGHRGLFGHRRAYASACCPNIAFTVAPTCCAPAPTCCDTFSSSAIMTLPSSVVPSGSSSTPTPTYSTPELRKDSTPATATEAKNPPPPVEPAADPEPATNPEPAKDAPKPGE
jgi:hypothetical protein